MFSTVRRLRAQLKNSAIEFFGSVNNALGSALNSQKKFLKWAEENKYRVEVLEFSSFIEAGFSYWQVRRGHSCVKAVLIDEREQRKNVYLMTAFGHGMTVKFVAAEEMIFKHPIIDFR